MPIAVAAGAGRLPGSSHSAPCANSAPATEPMNSVGVKMPPTAPEPVVAATAASLNSSTNMSAFQVQVPCRMLSTTL